MREKRYIHSSTINTIICLFAINIFLKPRIRLSFRSSVSRARAINNSCVCLIFFFVNRKLHNSNVINFFFFSIIFMHDDGAENIHYEDARRCANINLALK